MEWAIRSGPHTAEVTYQGQHKVRFPADGGCIVHDMPGDRIYGLFMGTFGHQVQGKQTFTDEANGIVAKL